MGGMMYNKMIMPKIKKGAGGDLKNVPKLIVFFKEFKAALKGTFFGGNDPECVDISMYAALSFWLFKGVEPLVKCIEEAGLKPWREAMEGKLPLTKMYPPEGFGCVKK
jgi:hypothetical protein